MRSLPSSLAVVFLIRVMIYPLSPLGVDSRCLGAPLPASRDADPVAPAQVLSIARSLGSITRLGGLAPSTSVQEAERAQQFLRFAAPRTATAVLLSLPLGVRAAIVLFLARLGVHFL